MPFGLVNTPAVFQWFINEVLWDTLNQYSFVYLDDILIFSNSPEEPEMKFDIWNLMVNIVLVVRDSFIEGEVNLGNIFRE